MTIIRVQHNRNYTCVNNAIANDARLSWKARGIWFFAFTRMDDWKFYVSDLVKRATDGKDSVNAGLKELENAGYLKRSRYRNSDGTFDKETEWIFYETPLTGGSEPKPENPLLDDISRGKPSTNTFEPKPDFPELENPPLISTDSKLSTDPDDDSDSAGAEDQKSSEKIKLSEQPKETTMIRDFEGNERTIGKSDLHRLLLHHQLSKSDLDLIWQKICSYCAPIRDLIQFSLKCLGNHKKTQHKGKSCHNAENSRYKSKRKETPQPSNGSDETSENDTSPLIFHDLQARLRTLQEPKNGLHVRETS